MTNAVAPLVLVVDDDAAVRSGLSLLLRSAGLNVRGFDGAQAFLEECADVPCGCVLLDVRMPGLSGLELQRRLKDMGVQLPVIILTGHGDVPMAVRAMKHGAFDFIEKPFNDQHLLDRVNDALLQDARDCERRTQRQDAARRLETLTRRERDVVDCLAKGMANKVIATELAISERTVELHRAHAMEKLGLRSVAQLMQHLLLASGERP